MSPSISLVIPTLNASGEIGCLIDALLRQTILIDEILIVDSDSEDGTRDIVSSYKDYGVKFIGINRCDFNHGLTRHRALLKTKGDYVIFMTQDAVPANNRLIENLIEPFHDKQVSLVTARQLPKKDARRFEQLVRKFNYPPESRTVTRADIAAMGIKAFFNSDVCAAYRRTAYIAVGGFEETPTNEDMLIAARLLCAGWKTVYEADAKVLHSHNLSLVEQYKRNKAIGSFMYCHERDFGFVSEVGEGKRLVRFVLSELRGEKRMGEALSFCLDCAARLLGNRVGRMAAKGMMNHGQYESCWHEGDA